MNNIKHSNLALTKILRHDLVNEVMLSRPPRRSQPLGQKLEHPGQYSCKYARAQAEGAEHALIATTQGWAGLQPRTQHALQ
jgi:hypothetical protein